MPRQQENKMNIKINSPLLWKLSAVIFISMLITCSGGCKFGKKVNTGSSGVHRVIKPSDLIKQPNGTFKLKPGIPIKSKPIVRSEPVRTPPKPIKIESAKPTYKKEELKAIGSKSEFSPSITDTSNIKLDVVKNKADIKNTASVKEGDSNLGGTANPTKSSSVTIKYGELILFYLLGFLILIFLFIVYDIYKAKTKEIAQAKKPTRKRRRKSKKRQAKPKAD